MQICMQTCKQTNKQKPNQSQQKRNQTIQFLKPNFKAQNFSLTNKKKKKKTLFNPIQDIHFIETKTKGQQKKFPAKD